jgi:membrane-associated phospholipid phosphatase
MKAGRTLVALSAIVLTAQPARSQGREPWFTKSDAGVLAAGIASSAVLIGWDRQISDAFRESSLQGNRSVRGLMDVAGFSGDPGGAIFGAALWASGHFGNDRTRERLGLRAIEAIALSGAFTLGGKAILGRARPDQSPGLPRTFVLGRGFGNRSEFQAFPSGHATAAFAVASAIDAELDRIAPEHPRWIVPLLYSVAAANAVSRVYHDRHWASDVVMGSAIGFVGGRIVVRLRRDQR